LEDIVLEMNRAAIAKGVVAHFGINERYFGLNAEK
jgi:hypothetical protein